ncbi:MAG: PD40 domain-containing protein [Candidatus Marinimicrobia bacterium]|nr:PD40 domain-containing protein [Candidatus Neomarinimicrobiota bacterium]
MKNNQILLIIFLFIGCNENSENIIDDNSGNPPDSGVTIMPVGPGAFHSEPSWSTDGETITYYSYGYVGHDTIDEEVVWYRDPDSIGIWFISPDGSNNIMFLKWGYSPDWSPDGDWIVFKYGQIYKIKVDGDSLTQLTFEGRNHFPAWSPDGKHIAYDSDIDDTKYDIWIMSADGGNKTNISQESDSADQGGWRDPSWSPDGQWIIHERYISNDEVGTEIFVMDASGANSHWLGHGSNPQFSPDSSRIIFVSTNKESFGIWIMDSNGTNLSRLTDQGYWPSWSPDGDKIVYEGPEQVLWIMDANGENKRQLTSRPN